MLFLCKLNVIIAEINGVIRQNVRSDKKAVWLIEDKEEMCTTIADTPRFSKIIPNN